MINMTKLLFKFSFHALNHSLSDVIWASTFKNVCTNFKSIKVTKTWILKLNILIFWLFFPLYHDVLSKICFLLKEKKGVWVSSSDVQLDWSSRVFAPPPPFKLINLDPSLPEEAENKKIQISFGFAANKINRN